MSFFGQLQYCCVRQKKRLWRLLSNELSRLVSFGLEKMLIVFLWVEQMWHLGASCSPWLSQECGVNFSWQADSQFVPISRLSSICAFFFKKRELAYDTPQEHGSPRLTIGHLSSKKGEQQRESFTTVSLAMCSLHTKRIWSWLFVRKSPCSNCENWTFTKNIFSIRFHMFICLFFVKCANSN